MYNKIMLMGRVASAPEMKISKNNVEFITFRIAVERRYAPIGEKRQTDFINVIGWGKTAEFIAKYFGKGRMIFIEGELQTRQYVDRDTGKQSTWYEVVADRVSFTGETKKDKPAPAPRESADEEEIILETLAGQLTTDDYTGDEPEFAEV